MKATTTTAGEAVPEAARGPRFRRIRIECTQSAEVDATVVAMLQCMADAAAEISGCFVEDDDLMRLAALPFSFEICRTTSVRRSMDARSLEQALARTAEQVRARLEQTARGAGRRFTFQVQRGYSRAGAEEVRGLSREVELLVLCAERTRDWLPQRVHVPPRGPLVVVAGDTPDARRAYAVALELSQALERALHVLVPPGFEPEGQRAEGDSTLREPAFETVANLDLHACLERAERLDAAILVLPMALLPPEEGALAALRARTRFPIALVAREGGLASPA